MKGRDAPAQRDPDANVCVGCGLCCDGTLFTHLAALDEGDLGLPLRALGVYLIYEADPPAFALPCPAVAHGVCTIHDLHRPMACRQFECRISTGVTRGEVTRSEARAVIERTRAVRDDVRAGRAPEAELRRLVHAHFWGD